MFYKIITHTVPIYPEDQLAPSDTRTRHGNKLSFKHLGASKDPYKFSFYPRTVTQWNMLPNAIQGAVTVETFKVFVTVPVLVSVTNQ